ncbi:hypothetical protein AJ80_02710 [Polytolypa hystricis UAMH7299]|uniref:Uncharacterized protein n=1 Tax=Polytolypa hystricis (strain UAMH7299) TaxID=1447883 RepID=A0A2B7YPS1_POLH7|nr:hypothetical protein AJ80_02710 [Polytolypa hystricis UAMH7299]
METTTSKTKDSAPILFKPEPPIRILVQTLTHLVPGNGNTDRIMFILNRSAYNDQFASNSRRCFFLLDAGQSSNDDDVPVLSYEWTGESLIPMPQLAQDPMIQTKLKEDFSFTWQPSERKERPRREIVKAKLYSDTTLSNFDMDYMRENPEDLQWLKTHVRLRLWQKFVAEVNK